MVEKQNVYLTPFKRECPLHIYLPPYYYESKESYPVIYMYDGQNLFHDEEATYGTSWNLEEFLDHYDKKVIVVGMECSHEGNNRLSEYCPYNHESKYWGKITGLGQEMMDWVVHELKPYIDTKYRTQPFRECTMIAGSSMGGLMAYYTLIAHNDIFSKAGCLSPALGFCMKELNQLMFETPINPDTKAYFSIGKKETGRNQYALNTIWKCNDYLIHRNANAYVYLAEGGHNEATWRSQNQIMMDFLWK